MSSPQSLSLKRRFFQKRAIRYNNAMEPLSLGVRRLYALFFFAIFVIVLPIVGLYASGYRLQGFSLVPTGGVYVSAPVSGFLISLNGEASARSGLFSHSFFFDNLAPGSYVVQASADGYYPWSKTLIVESRVVSDVQVLAIQQPLIVRELIIATSSALSAESATSTMRVISAAEYRDLGAVFAATTTAAEAATGEMPGTARVVADEGAGAVLVIEDGDLFMRWEDRRAPPSSFCARPSQCDIAFALEDGEETVTDSSFFAGGVLYRTEASGVYFSEADIRPPRLVIPVYTEPGASYRIISGNLYIENKGSLFEVVGF